MKRALMVMGLTGALTIAGATPAQAINKEWSAALGFLGGVLVASHSDVDVRIGGGYGHDRWSQPTCTPAPCAPRVYEQRTVYVPHPVYVREQPVYVEQPRCEPQQRGHYEYREERCWIEGSWRTEQLGCNVYRKSWCPGRYETTRVRVWVSGW